MEDTQSQRHFQPIAPASNSSNAKHPVASEPPPQKIIASPERRSSALQVNRQWVLPPRPKPGRKPKNPPVPKRRVGRPLSSSKQQQYSKAEVSKTIKQTSPTSWEVHIGSSGSPAPYGSPSHIPGNLEEDEKCTLCTREDCMCETIGLNKPITPSSPQSKTLPSLDSILNSSAIKMDAVPLVRNSTNSGVKKFKRVEALRPLHPPLPGLSPSEGLSQHENCGFCTESSECACADASQLQTQQQQQQQQQPEQLRSQSLPHISTGSPQPIQPIMAYPSQYLSGVPQMSSSHVAPPHMVSTPSPYPFMISPTTLQSQQPQQQLPQAQPLQPVSSPKVSEVQLNDDVLSCGMCEKDAMSMLFCLSLASANSLDPSSVSLPCHLAFRTLQKHHRFEGCDLGKLVSRLEVHHKQVGVQSINRVLQELDKGEFTT